MDEAQKDITIAEVEAILQGGELEGLIGIKEGECFEAKPQRPFDLALGKKANVSIAKYFASFANNKGGVIVFGLEVEADTVLITDIVKKVNLFPEEEFYKSSELVSRGQDATYPTLRDVRARWYPSKADAKLGLGALFIPPQDEGKKYFMVKGNKEIEGETIQGEFYGIPIRGGSQTEWLLSNRVHGLSLQRPRDWQVMGAQIMDRLDILEEKISRIPAPATVPGLLPGPGKDELKEIIDKIFKING